MKILYAIQGTGNGHISRARDIIPALQKIGKTDVLISGTQADVEIVSAVKWRFNGLSFFFGKKGGIDVMQTYKKARLRQFYKEVMQLPVYKYDLVISDFEPVSAWACYLSGKKCIALSHQCAVLAENAPRPGLDDPIGKFVLKNYAPCSMNFGFHFESYGPNIYTPVIRSQVRNMEVSDLGHYTVYLPSYDDEFLYEILKKFKGVSWEVFSKYISRETKKGNVTFRKVQNEVFGKSLASASGVLCGAGFETPAEALYLGKKLMVIPMKGQYEQQCNAAALKAMGVGVLKGLKPRYEERIQSWLEGNTRVAVNYPDQTDQVLSRLVKEYRESGAFFPEEDFLKFQGIMQAGKG
jgi:uncharacterized protein (TIGR00661 family)